ncbi:DeoR/GlpR family DNA-binding transcription regulator [Solirubrobacter soli]|uniref:DeoR/GlpR family DNA-binding transcription regulator n=1 Tax=Solirubrobacter soli TaxID=363832 RepID=UPI0003F8BE38|nr:DeoR/GlpR family DNA-binding transcription regulator [Solirubrobacter soli]
MHFSSERQAAILARLDRDGRVISATLAEELEVSPDSIRRDLQDLEAAGALQRVHGGAIRPPADNPAFLERLEEEDPGKLVVGRRAAELIEDDQLVVIGGGTTALELAHALRRDLRATVLTSSPDVALALRRHPGVTVDVLGGRLDRASQTLTGGETVEQLRRVRPDVCVVSPCWVDLDLGVTLRERAEAEVVKTMIERSRRVIGLVPFMKMGNAGPYVVADVEQLDVLVTDAPEHMAVEYGRLGMQLVYA